ncbi:MAG: Hpt domain-containing protein [Sphingomonadales bacterium]|nr:Hpt domain-containing protein [Sphingomonadales bacterium]MDE2570037.1 Hpt domain-containing protein [Sphingomonadales bacterium]
MAYLGEAIDANLAAVSGEDAALFHELRAAFIESASHHFDLMRRSRCDGNWQVAAMRLKGLAASFHAAELVTLADEALQSAPGEPAVLRSIDRLITGLSATGA